MPMATISRFSSGDVVLVPATTVLPTSLPIVTRKRFSASYL